MAHQQPGQLPGVGDGGAAQDELGLGPVKGAQAHQAAQHVGQIAAEDAPVAMDFVDDDVAQVLKQLHPLGVVGQDAGVEHVRVGDHHVPGLADGLAGGALGVPS